MISVSQFALCCSKDASETRSSSCSPSWALLMAMAIVTVGALLVANYGLSQEGDWTWITDGSCFDIQNANSATLYALVPAVGVNAALLTLFFSGDDEAKSEGVFSETREKLRRGRSPKTFSVSNHNVTEFPTWVTVRVPGGPPVDVYIQEDQTFSGLFNRIENRYEVVPQNPSYFVITLLDGQRNRQAAYPQAQIAAYLPFDELEIVFTN